MATAGVDGIVKLWDCRSWKVALRSWNSRGGNATLAWSQRGCLAVASGGAVNVGTTFGFQLRVIITLPTLQGLFHAISVFSQSCALSTSTISDSPPICETPYFPRVLPFPGYPCYWA
jgi:WD40 repeat protein